jgi:hypothetical protein
MLGFIWVLREYERGVVFRLGRLAPKPKGPGLVVLIPVVDRLSKVDLRTVTLNVPAQDVTTKDNVPARDPQPGSRPIPPHSRHQPWLPQLADTLRRSAPTRLRVPVPGRPALPLGGPLASASHHL